MILIKAVFITFFVSCSFKLPANYLGISLKNSVNKAIKREIRSAEFSHKFLYYLEKWHPGDQDKIYHNFTHTLLVADLMDKVIKENATLTNKERTLLLMAALIHDIDPYRNTNTPPVVSSTINFLKGKEASFIFDQVEQQKLLTLINYTDFNPSPLEQEKIWAQADEMAQKYFPNPDWAKKWGRHLAAVDKLAMYVRDWSFAKNSVKGLAFEFKKTDEDLLKNTYKFLKPLKEDLGKLNLSHELRKNFSIILKQFKLLASE